MLTHAAGHQAHGLTVTACAICSLVAAPPTPDTDNLAALLQYANAHAWYKNLDKLIHYVNADGRLNVFYSRSGWLTAFVAEISLPPLHCVCRRDTHQSPALDTLHSTMRGVPCGSETAW